MVGFSLEVDYRPQGATQAKRDLDSLATTAQRTQVSFERTGQTMAKAFATTGGGISATQGLASAATAFNALNTEAALFAGSRALLDIGRTAADFKELTGAVGGARGAMSALFAIVRANPLLTIATVISTVAAGMSIFGNRTSEATSEVRKQASALDQLLERQREITLRAGLGGGDQRGSSGSLRSALEAIRLDPEFDSRTISARRAAELFGVSEIDLRTRLSRNNQIGQSATEFAPAITNSSLEARRFRRVDFPSESLFSAGRGILEERSIQQEGAGFRAAEMRLESERAAQREQERFEAQRQAEQQSLENMRALRAEAEAFGATIGDAFFNVASGTQTARQAIAALVSDLARAASRQAFAGLFGNLAVGATGTQASQSIRTPGVDPA